MLRRNHDPLAIYLNDHLAGSTAAIELGERLVDETAGAVIGPELAAIIEEIREDRRALEQLMERLEIARDPVKRGAGWIGEKLSRLKLVIGSGPAELARLLSLEALSTGVQGKASLWLSLQQLVDHPVIASTELDELRRRAKDQLARLDDLRARIAPAALPVSHTTR
jgi:hypothetical protein